MGALKIIRVRPGVYRTTLHEREVYLDGTGTGWNAVYLEDTLRPIAVGKTKKELISRLEVLLRRPQDRTVSDTLKLFRRSEIKQHTQLTVEGIRGKCSFIAYTRKDDGSEWIDILIPNGNSRTVRPDRIKTVHRTKGSR